MVVPFGTPSISTPISGACDSPNMRMFIVLYYTKAVRTLNSAQQEVHERRRIIVRLGEARIETRVLIATARNAVLLGIPHIADAPTTDVPPDRPPLQNLR